MWWSQLNLLMKSMTVTSVMGATVIMLIPMSWMIPHTEICVKTKYRRTHWRKESASWRRREDATARMWMLPSLRSPDTGRWRRSARWWLGCPAGPSLSTSIYSNQLTTNILQVYTRCCLSIPPLPASCSSLEFGQLLVFSLAETDHILKELCEEDHLPKIDQQE